MVPKPAHGTFRLDNMTSSTMVIMEGFLKLFDRIVNKRLLIRKVNICVGNLLKEDEIKKHMSNWIFLQILKKN